MISSRLIALPILFAGLAAPLAPAPAQGPVNNADLKWGPGPSGLPEGAEIALLSGNPEEEGMFTIRLKFPANYAVPPHFHPAPELVTVIDGELSLGMGDTADKAKTTKLNVGGYAVAPATMHHYAFAGSEGATVQVTSHGPFKITYVNAADDPRK